MGALPKHKISTFRKGRRRAGHPVMATTTVICPHCGQTKKAHYVCANCGKS